ncbi:MAG: iron ABC transporter permease [Clostridia bacterium]|nr:iron ABC transporter permease [Clostridia bacterium]
MSSSQRYSTNKKRILFIVLSVLLLITAVLSILLGAVRIPLKEIFAFFTGGEISFSHANIIRYTRLPRTFACIVAGAALAVSGVIIQLVLNNPLSAPHIIGVNSGAGFAVCLCNAFLPALPSLMPLCAFGGALLAVMIVLTIAEKTGASKMTLVLAGVAVSAIFSSAIDTIISFDSNAVAGYMDFKIGSFSGVTYKRLIPAAIVIGVMLLLSLIMSNELDVLRLGKDQALSLGLNVRVYRIILLVISAALAGSVVSFCGIISFVGLVVPHIMRRFVGEESKTLLVSSMLGGAFLVTASDLISRLLFAPFELPVGILLSFIGGPFFIVLLLKQRKGRIHD